MDSPILQYKSINTFKDILFGLMFITEDEFLIILVYVFGETFLVESTGTP